MPQVGSIRAEVEGGIGDAAGAESMQILHVINDIQIGGAEYCAEKLTAEITALKPTHLSCFMGLAGIGRQETLASMERFGAEVLPLLEPVLKARGLADAA